MFSYPNLWVMISGILLALAIVISSVYFVNKMFVNDTKDVLVRFIILVFTALVALFIVDKVIAFKIKLLPEDTNKELFDLIQLLFWYKEQFKRKPLKFKQYYLILINK
jgi:membrane protein YdbS with pleckstrin-like domain